MSGSQVFRIPKSTINKKPPELKADADPLFAGLRQEEAVELCQKLATEFNGDLERIQAEFIRSTLYDPETAQAAIMAGIDAWFNS